MEMPLMRPWRLPLKHVIEAKAKKSQETAEAETIFNGTIIDTLAKTEGTERRNKHTREAQRFGSFLQHVRVRRVVV